LRLPLLRQVTAAALFASLLLQSTAAVAPTPSWWGTQSVLSPSAVADDFAAANVGQLKYFAAKAAAEMNAQLSGGAGSAITALMAAWNTPPATGVTRDDFAALTAGQLKAVAGLFYDRLAAAGAGTQGVYPWGGSGTVADDYAVVNVGQLKAVFAFDVPRLVVTTTTGVGIMASGGSTTSDKTTDGPTTDGITTNSFTSLNGVGLGTATTSAATAGTSTGGSDANGNGWDDATEIYYGYDPASGITPDANEVLKNFASEDTEAFLAGDSWYISNYVRKNVVIKKPLPWFTEHSWYPNGNDVQNRYAKKPNIPPLQSLPLPGSWENIANNAWIGFTDYYDPGNSYPFWLDPCGSIPNGWWAPMINRWDKTTNENTKSYTDSTQLKGWSINWKRYRLRLPKALPVAAKMSFLQVTYKWDKDNAVWHSDPWDIFGNSGYGTYPDPTIKEVKTVTMTLPAHQTTGAWLEVCPKIDESDHSMLSVRRASVEINSRDRAVTGSIPILQPDKRFILAFSGAGGKNYGAYEIPAKGSSQAVYVYESEDDIFSEEEAAKYEAKTLDKNAVNQQVVLVREGDHIRFYTVADKLGEFKITLYSDGKKLCEVKQQLTEEKDFARLIAAINGMVGGQLSPANKAWDGDPDPFDGDQTIYAAPPPNLPLASLNNMVDAAPQSVALEYTDPTVLRTRDGFNQFLNLVREHTTDQEWNIYSKLLLKLGAVKTLPTTVDDITIGRTIGTTPGTTIETASDTTPGSTPLAAGTAGEGGGGWWPTWGSEKAEPRNEMKLPAALSNRGLVAKCLVYWVKKLIVAHVATGEGVVFGLWDGLSSDVEGVCDVLRTPAELYNRLKDPWGAASEIYHGFKVIYDLGWDGCKKQVIGLFNAFMTEQQDRLDIMLGDQCQDPVYFGAYMAGYLSGYIGEQVAIAVITAGSVKVGWVGKAIRTGAKVLDDYKKLTNPLHQFSKAFTKVRSKYTRTADELSAMRAAASKCGPDGRCIVSGSLVLMADYSFKKIDDIKTDDWVWADDPTDDKPAAPARVQFQTSNFTIDPVVIYWDADGDLQPDGSVTASPVHPFYVTNVGWVEADHLQAGQHLIDDHGRSTTITRVETVTGRVSTFDIGLDQLHGFFTGATPKSFTLTHNANWDVIPYWKKADFIPGRVPPTVYQKHHFFFDAWLAVKYEGLYRQGRRDKSFPTIQLTPEDHKTMHLYANNYLMKRFGIQDINQMTSQLWAEISVEEMEKLAIGMGNAVGIPKSKMKEVFGKQNQWFFKKMNKVFGCLSQ